MSADSYGRELRRMAQRAGCEVRQTHNNHYRLIHPDTGAILVLPATPGTKRQQVVLRSWLRRQAVSR